jgi:Pentapeptide repeats (8 copies)/Bacterial Ig domain
MSGRLLRMTGTVVVIVVASITPVLGTSGAASADTVVDGCTIVSNPTSTNFTDCPGADLGDANLSGVNLSFADLAGASFVDCSVVSGTECNAANLSGATLTYANVSSGSFFDAIPYAPCGVPSCAEVASGAADLSAANLSSANLSSAQLFQVNLSDAVLINANLTSATFTGCFGTICQGGATLTGANLTGATLTDADFSGTILVPPDQSVIGTSTGAVVTWSAPQSLPGATPGTCTESSGSNFPIGTTTVSCQVLDDHGDITTGTFTVAVSQYATSAGLTSSVSGPVGVGALVTYTTDVDANAGSVPGPTPFPSGGTVAFTDNGATISGCSAVPLVEGDPSEASCSVTFSTTGSHVIQPIYSGSGIFEGDYGLTLTQNVVSATPPSTSVVLPSSGATVTGATWLDAGASSPVGIASVSFEITGPAASNTVIAKATATPYGWLANWSSMIIANGTYTLQSVATDVDGTSSTSAPITITVDIPLSSTSVVIPSTGATQSGTAAVLDASTSPNGYYSTSVYKLIFEVSGGPSNLSDQVIATGALTLYGWLAKWNTTSVPNGSYTLQSVGTYSGGGTVTSAPITISVSNVPPPPTTSVVIPSTGATQSGTAAVLDASASANVTKVLYEVSGGPSNVSDRVIATGTATLYGWLAQWNTTTVANGTYTLQSVASYTSGVSGTSPGVSVTVVN